MQWEKEKTNVCKTIAYIFSISSWVKGECELWIVNMWICEYVCPSTKVLLLFLSLSHFYTLFETLFLYHMFPWYESKY